MKREKSEIKPNPQPVNNANDTEITKLKTMQDLEAVGGQEEEEEEEKNGEYNDNLEDIPDLEAIADAIGFRKLNAKEQQEILKMSQHEFRLVVDQH